MVKTSSILKYILGIILFGLVLWANPIEGYCYNSYGVTKTIPNGTTLPYNYSNFLPNQLGVSNPTFGDTGIYNIPFDNLPFTTNRDGSYSFEYNFSMVFFNTLRNVDCSGYLLFQFYLYYTDSLGVQRGFACASSYNDIFLSDDVSSHVININFPVTVNGRPDYMAVVVSTAVHGYNQFPWVFSPSESLQIELDALSSSSGGTYLAQMDGYIDATTFTGDGGSTTIQPSNWYQSNGSDYGTISTGAFNFANDGNIASTRLTGTVTMPAASSADYDGTISTDEINPSGSFFIFGIVTSTSNFVENESSSFDYDQKLGSLGFNPMNFAMNGSVWFGNHLFDPEFLDPICFDQLLNGSFNGVFAATKSGQPYPIAVMGDTRSGDYCISFGFRLTSALSASDLSTIFSTPWGFEFNKGQQTSFGLPSNTRVTYTYYPSDDTYYYLNIFFFFTSPDYFDSFLLRSGPQIANVKDASFSFCKYVGTVSDQITADDQHWNYNNPSHTSTSSAVSTATSTISTFQTIEDNSFQNLTSAMTSAGVDSFSFDTMSTPITAVSSLITSVYNVFPAEIKWLILAVLCIGIFAVIISSNFYVNKD